MEKTADLELKALGGFIGTEQYYKVLGELVTDGVKYIMDNGYAWFVTDALSVIAFTEKFPKLRNQPFLSVKLKRTGDSEAELIIEDGNYNQLYKQHYDFTDAKRDLTLFYENGVLLLNSEH